MIRLFQQNTLVQLLLILAALLLLWWPTLADPAAMLSASGADSGPLYGWLVAWLGQWPRAAAVASMAVVLAEGLLLNLLLADLRLMAQNTLLPTLLYVVAMSATGCSLSPMLFVNGAMLVFLQQVALRSTLISIPTGKICGATAMIGVASLFYPPAVALLLTYLLVAIRYRLYGWRDWLAMLMGLAAPYIAVAVVLWLVGDVEAQWSQMADWMSGIGLHIAPLPTWHWVADLVLAAVMLYSFVAFRQGMDSRSVVWKNNALSVSQCAIGGAAMVLLTQLVPTEFGALAIPFALCGSTLLTPRREHYGMRRRRTWMADTLLIIILITAWIC